VALGRSVHGFVSLLFAGATLLCRAGYTLGFATHLMFHFGCYERLGRKMDQAGEQTSSGGNVTVAPVNTSSPPPPSTCGSSGGSVGGGGGVGESVLVPVVLDDLTFDNRQVKTWFHVQLLYAPRCNQSVNQSGNLLGPFYGAIAVPSVTRCRCCRCCCGHRCAGGVRQ